MRIFLFSFKVTSQLKLLLANKQIKQKYKIRVRRTTDRRFSVDLRGSWNPGDLWNEWFNDFGNKVIRLWWCYTFSAFGIFWWREQHHESWFMINKIDELFLDVQGRHFSKNGLGTFWDLLVIWCSQQLTITTVIILPLPHISDGKIYHSSNH